MKKRKIVSYLFIILALILVIAVFFGLYFYEKNKNIKQSVSTNNKPANNTKPEVKKTPNTTFSAPIYMYHHIQDVSDQSDQLAYGLSLSPDLFQKEMDYLKTNHYETLTLDEMLDTPLDKKVVLTFDDGYIDIFQNAYPIMKKLGFHGVAFVITDFVGTPDYMTWDNLKILQKAGWEIDSHTVNHLDLATLNTDDAKYQIVESKKIIEKQLGIKVNFFCYPSGKYTDETVSLLKTAGYKGATTTQYGTENSVENIFTLERIRINGGTSLDSFISPF